MSELELFVAVVPSSGWPSSWSPSASVRSGGASCRSGWERGWAGVVLSASRAVVDTVARAMRLVYGPNLVVSLARLSLPFLPLHVFRLFRTEILAQSIAILTAAQEPKAEHR